MGIEELRLLYDFKETPEQLQKRISKKKYIHPIHKKHVSATFVIQDIWGHVDNGNLSLSKARELTSSVIEKHFKKINKK